MWRMRLILLVEQDLSGLRLLSATNYYIGTGSRVAEVGGLQDMCELCVVVWCGA